MRKDLNYLRHLSTERWFQYMKCHEDNEKVFAKTVAVLK